jgi:hypothetical protein
VYSGVASGACARDGQTRLISRNRIATPGAAAPARLFGMLVTEPGSLIMERKMLLGIKRRAERRGPGTPR